MGGGGTGTVAVLGLGVGGGEAWIGGWQKSRKGKWLGCCGPRCHTSKRGNIKGSSFDEYKTESPAEKHSAPLPF